MITGSGHETDPFSFKTQNIGESAATQRFVITDVLKLGKYDEIVLGRNYHAHPSGLPGNTDLCETVYRYREGTRSVWFDLRNTIESAGEARERAAVNQVVVDDSQKLEAPVFEISSLNEARFAAGLAKLTLIDNEVTSFKTYGLAVENPVVVAGFIGLYSYIVSLRFAESPEPVKSNILWSFCDGGHPVDCLEITSGELRRKLLVCIYGSKNDRVNPFGFTRVPFTGRFYEDLSDYVSGSRFEVMCDPKGTSPIGIATFDENKNIYRLGLVADSVDKYKDAIVSIGGHLNAWSRPFQRRRIVAGVSNTQSSTPPQPIDKIPAQNIDLCWFSGDPADRASVAVVPLYKEISRGGVVQRAVKYQTLEVRIPRSLRAFEFHQKQIKFRNWGSIGIGAVCFFFTVSWIGGWSIPLAIASSVVAKILLKKYYLKSPGNWRELAQWTDFPAVKDLLGQGWSDKEPRI